MYIQAATPIPALLAASSPPLSRSYEQIAQVVHDVTDLVYHQTGHARIHQLEEGLRNFADQLKLRQGVQLFRGTPSGITNKVHRYLALSAAIAKLIDGDEEGPFRRTLHDRPNHGTIQDYLAKAREQGFKDAIPLLEELDALLTDIFAGQVDLDNMKPRLGRLPFADEIPWPDDAALSKDGMEGLDQETLGRMAVAVRRVFERHEMELDTKNRYYLMRLAIALDVACFGLCRWKPAESQPKQAVKLATIIRVLYGCGFGKESWLTLAEHYDRLAADWNGLEGARRDADFYRYGVLAAHMFEDVRAAYHVMFDDVMKEHGHKWQLNEEQQRSYSRSMYRSGGLFQLRAHLNQHDIQSGNHKIAQTVLELLAKPRPNELPYQAYFLGMTEVDDIRILGNKGWGLHDLMMRGEPVPPGFVLPPLVLDKAGLNKQQQRVIRQAVSGLEAILGRSLSDGSLEVSVRSGAAVAMPGIMKTQTHVKTIDGVMKAVEKVYQSWNAPQAKKYRMRNGIPDGWGTAITIQAWVDTKRTSDSGFGFAVSRSEDGLSNGVRTRYGSQIEGVDLASGTHSGSDKLPLKLNDELRKRIRQYEDWYGYPVEVEFAVHRGQLLILQKRRASLTYEDEVRWVAARVRQDKMTLADAIQLLGTRRRMIRARETRTLATHGDETVLLRSSIGEGLPYVGRLALRRKAIVDVKKKGAQAIFVTDNPNATESAALALEAGAVIFKGGNRISHLEAILSSGNNSYIGGVDLTIDKSSQKIRIGSTQLSEGDEVTIQPETAVLYQGAIPVITEPSAVAGLIDWLFAGAPRDA